MKSGKGDNCPGWEHVERFAITGDRNILDEDHFGIVNGQVTVNVRYRDALSIRGLYAPPYVSSDFSLEGRLFGEKVPTDRYAWYPFEVRRGGRVNGVRVSSAVTLAAEGRALLLSCDLINDRAEALTAPVQFAVAGGLDWAERWEFQKPATTTPCETAVREGRLIRSNGTGAIALGTNVPGMLWEEFSRHWCGQVKLPAGGRRVFYVAVTIGPKNWAVRTCEKLMADPARAVAAARWAGAVRAAEVFAKVPEFRASDQRLEKFYHRALLPLLLNRWEVNEFVLNPYYSTGSVNGGCVCSYLWDFGEGWEILPLADPAALREHVKCFLSIDLTRHFAFLPVTGEAFGPWYYVNQEKIIFSIYYYVLLTGDVGFLAEQVHGRSILEWVEHQATVGDDLSKPVALVDYGKGNHHLELRGRYRYENVMPDLNARRYANYCAAAALYELAGRPRPELRRRAEALKALIKRRLWSDKDKWFWCLDEEGKKYLRYTVQMFKLIGSAVLDRPMERGLLSHLNEREFLSDWGLHSMSKLDEAYDQVDIDNGGGGSYVSFPPQIIERLYRAGHTKLAEDIFRRILWWGERLVYWGDSVTANEVDYRRDTPLQNTIGALAGAAAIIFGMFGVQVTPTGQILINPSPPSFAPTMSLKGLRIRGRVIDIAVKNAKTYTVTTDGRQIVAKIGKRVCI